MIMVVGVEGWGRIDSVEALDVRPIRKLGIHIENHP